MPIRLALTALRTCSCWNSLIWNDRAHPSFDGSVIDNALISTPIIQKLSQTFDQPFSCQPFSVCAPFRINPFNPLA